MISNTLRDLVYNFDKYSIREIADEVNDVVKKLSYAQYDSELDLSEDKKINIHNILIMIDRRSLYNMPTGEIKNFLNQLITLIDFTLDFESMLKQDN